MSIRARRPATEAAATNAPLAPTAPPPRTGTSRRMPGLPLVAGVAGLALIGTAWTTRWSPGPPRTSTDAATHFTVEIAPEQQRVINSWPRFFICYDLAYENVIDPTLRANLRANGSLQFPGDKVEVELPAPGTHPAATDGGSEDELIQVRQSVLDALSRDATGARQQCAGGVPVQVSPAAVPAAPPPAPAASANGAAPAPANGTAPARAPANAAPPARNAARATQTPGI